MRKLRTRILAGAAVAAFTGAAAFAAVNVTDSPTTVNTVALTTSASQTATAKAGTTLSIAAGRLTIEAGRPDTISGKLTTGSAPAARRVVELVRYDAKAKKWVPVRANLTREGGVVAFAIRPLITAEYELVFYGNPALAGSRSAPVTITVTR